ncbi:hypothetical protein [Rhodococcus jostii]|uniref:hypothetical protein n=1 Tax=Rhodococcus jostii TaxID=132919 RepID=UPI00362EB9E1
MGDSSSLVPAQRARTAPVLAGAGSTVVSVRRLVDAMIGLVEEQWPGVEYRIVLDRTLNPLLAKDAALLVCEGNLGQIGGGYRGPVYRGVLIETGDLIDPDRIFAAPMLDRRNPESFTAPTYVGSVGAGAYGEDVRPVGTRVSRPG